MSGGYEDPVKRARNHPNVKGVARWHNEVMEQALLALPVWRRILGAMDTMFAAGRGSACDERVSGGGNSLPEAQSLIERKEQHWEYRMLSESTTMLEKAFGELRPADQEFVQAYYYQVGSAGDRRQNAADILNVNRATVTRMRNKVLSELAALCKEKLSLWLEEGFFLK